MKKLQLILFISILSTQLFAIEGERQNEIQNNLNSENYITINIDSESDKIETNFDEANSFFPKVKKMLRVGASLIVLLTGLLLIGSVVGLILAPSLIFWIMFGVAMAGVLTIGYLVMRAEPADSQENKSSE